MLEDSTLREGEQSPGVVFSTEEKVRLARMLADFGVDALEVGTPTMGGPEAEAIRALVAADLGVRLIGWNRGRREDLEASFELGLEAVHIGLPSSDQHLEKKFGRTRRWVLETMQELVALAKSNGAWVSVSAEDVGRANPEFLIEYAQNVMEAGADRLRLSDTIGVLRPEAVRALFARLSSVVELPLQAHMHNDFGLATANTLAAVEGGAEQVHVTVNGLGERAGIAPLDEVVMGLRHHYGVDLGCRTEMLKECCDFVAGISGRPIAAGKAITGSAVFEHESGIHVDGILKSADAFEPFPPELIGAARRVVIGKHSGGAAIRHVLSAEGFEVDDGTLGDLTSAVRYESVRLKRQLNGPDLVRIYTEVSS